MQTAAAEFAEVMKFRFHAPIQASDGEAGRLAVVVVDAEKRIVTHIGIKLGFLFGRIYYEPINLVPDANPDVVMLSITLDDIRQKNVPMPPGIALTPATIVTAGGKTLGRLVQMTINNDTQVVRNLVVDRAVRGEVLVPGSTITTFGGRQIAVDLGTVSSDQLVPFQRDADLYRTVYDTIYAYLPLRIDLPGIEIHVIDGIVWLHGYVSSDVNRRLVEDQLQGITGITELHNELIADTDLAPAVSLALAHDPRTGGEHIGVYPALGEVRLRGRIHTPAARQAATEVASAVPGVKTVVNDLQVDPQAQVVPVLAGVTNEEDRVPGGK